MHKVYGFKTRGESVKMGKIDDIFVIYNYLF